MVNNCHEGGGDQFCNGISQGKCIDNPSGPVCICKTYFKGANCAEFDFSSFITLRSNNEQDLVIKINQLNERLDNIYEANNFSVGGAPQFFSGMFVGTIITAIVSAIFYYCHMKKQKGRQFEKVIRRASTDNLLCTSPGESGEGKIPIMKSNFPISRNLTPHTSTVNLPALLSNINNENSESASMTIKIPAKSPIMSKRASPQPSIRSAHHARSKSHELLEPNPSLASYINSQKAGDNFHNNGQNDGHDGQDSPKVAQYNRVQRIKREDLRRSSAGPSLINPHIVVTDDQKN